MVSLIGISHRYLSSVPLAGNIHRHLSSVFCVLGVLCVVLCSVARSVVYCVVCCVVCCVVRVVLRVACCVFCVACVASFPLTSYSGRRFAPPFSGVLGVSRGLCVVLRVALCVDCLAFFGFFVCFSLVIPLSKHACPVLLFLVIASLHQDLVICALAAFIGCRSCF